MSAELVTFKALVAEWFELWPSEWMVVGSNTISGLSFDFQKLCSYSGLDVLGLHTPEPTHQ